MTMEDAIKTVIFALILGAIFGGYTYVKEKTNPAPEQKIEKIHIGEQYPSPSYKSSYNIVINSVEVTQERNELVKADRVLKVNYTLTNKTDEPMENNKSLNVIDEIGHESLEYPLITNDPSKVEANSSATFNDYYTLPDEKQSYQIVLENNEYRKTIFEFDI